MVGRKFYDAYMTHYSSECPRCRGVLLPKKIEALRKAVEAIRRDRDYWYEKAMGRYP